MSSANSSIPLTALDFDTLKQNFLNYLTTQSVFKDYNFTGSNMNVLLDIMSYNTYLNAFYLNMVASEMFLDSAQKYDSVVSHAKELNYLPRSYQSSVAEISFTVNNPSQVNPLIIQKGTSFNGQNANGSYTFVTSQTTSYLSTNGTYNVANLYVYEGAYLTDGYIMDYSNTNQQFILSNPQIDVSSLVVTVTENGVNTFFTQAETLYNLDGTSNVFFLQAAQNGQYEILFGDGLFGRIPVNLSTISANYRVCNGTDADGVSVFSTNQNLFLNGPIITVSNSVNSANAESIESIRFSAPRYFAAQQRAVSSDDYSSLILDNFGSQVEDVTVYGGELLTPKQYGRVAVCIKPSTGTIAPNYLKNQISEYLTQYIAIPNRLLVTDPDYLYITVNANVVYNTSLTKYSASEIQTIVLNNIQAFSNNNLGKFGKNFLYSNFCRTIDDADYSIVNNDTEILITKRISPELNYATSYTLNFNNSTEIENRNTAFGYVAGPPFYDEPQLTSSVFTYTDANNVSWPYSYIRDDNYGTLVIYSTINGNFTILNNSIGTIDYNTGVVNINNLTTSYYQSYIELYMNPDINDVYVNNNIIALIDLADVIVNISTIS